MTQTAKIAIVLHNPKGKTGLIGETLIRLGYQLDIRCHLAGDPLHDLKDYKAVIVFGGKMSVNDEKEYPALIEEKKWIRECVAQNIPYLGICLGAQLLAQSFGGKVTKHHQKIVEIGFYHIYPTLEGFLGIFNHCPDKFFQWHNEGFTIPENAVKLAESDLYPNQAFRIGENAYGLQFHPEANQELIKLWHDRDPEELKHPGAQTIAAQWIDYKKLNQSIIDWLNHFIPIWLN